MRHFYTEPIGDRSAAVLSPEQTHHLTNVLRLGPGAHVVLFDGSGSDYTAVVETVDAAGARCRILERSPSRGEMCLPVTVYQAVIKGDHFDYAVQKMTETGAAAIVPFLAARSVRRPKNPGRFVERARRIAAEAAEQCERSAMPRISPICSFADVVRDVRGRFTIFAYEREDRRTLRELLRDGCPAAAAVIVGPEGGFAEPEISALLEAGAHAVSLGARILRSETAAPYVLAQLDYACCT